MKIKMGWDLSGAFGGGVGPYCVAESNIALITQGIAILLSDDQGAGYKVTLPAWEEMYLRICQYRRGQISQNIFNDKWYWDNSDFYHDCSSASVENDEVIICFMSNFEISLTLEAFETLIKNYLKLTKQNPDADKILEFEIEDAKLISCPEDYQTENTMKVKFYWRQEGLKLVPRTQVFSNQEVKNICVRILFDRDNNGYRSSDINIDEYEKLSIYLKDENSRKQNLINFDELNLNKFNFSEINFETNIVKVQTIDYLLIIPLDVFTTMLDNYINLIKNADKTKEIVFEIPEVTIHPTNNPNASVNRFIKFKQSVMFPDSWGRERVELEVNAAYLNRVEYTKGHTRFWQGETPGGIKVRGFTNPRVTVYPIFD